MRDVTTGLELPADPHPTLASQGPPSPTSGRRKGWNFPRALIRHAPHGAFSHEWEKDEKSHTKSQHRSAERAQNHADHAGGGSHRGRENGPARHRADDRQHADGDGAAALVELASHRVSPSVRAPEDLASARFRLR